MLNVVSVNALTDQECTGGRTGVAVCWFSGTGITRFAFPRKDIMIATDRITMGEKTNVVLTNSLNTDFML